MQPKDNISIRGFKELSQLFSSSFLRLIISTLLISFILILNSVVVIVLFMFFPFMLPQMYIETMCNYHIDIIIFIFLSYLESIKIVYTKNTPINIVKFAA